MSETHGLLADTYTWTIVSLLLFLGLAYRFGKKPVQGWLDGEIEKIRQQLEQAKRLRNEAEATLADYRVRQQVAMAEAEAIVTHAKAEAARLRQVAEADLQAALARHEQQALDRIRQAEREAMADVRQAVIAEAMNLAKTALAESMDQATAQRLIDQAIAEMPQLQATKAKAA
jgi:F-type H+-transporting ATPase subunit b